MAFKIARDSSRCFKIAANMPPRALKTAQGRFQVTSEPPKEAPKRPKSFKTIVLVNVVLHYRFLASDRLLRPQDGSKMAQEGLNRGPGGPQDGPKSAQNRPKSGPKGPQEAHFRASTGGPC